MRPVCAGSPTTERSGLVGRYNGRLPASDPPRAAREGRGVRGPAACQPGRGPPQPQPLAAGPARAPQALQGRSGQPVSSDFTMGPHEIQ
eukprot:scaffold207703_cov30-Prasinocladus_malaysianus.AAC.1